MTLKELSLQLPNRPGALVRVARILAREQINLAAISVDSTRTRGRVRLVVSDPTKARRLLEEAGYAVETQELIAVRLEDRAGSFLKVLDALASANVNVVSVAILVAKEGAQSLVGLSTDDMARARKVLREGGFVAEAVERLISNADLIAAAPAIPAESVGLLL
ncbi:MAG TPA: ACT domain-containing protein [Thermoplasmata archaeon]|nr:ACT domain-containing protein [Thermoplasmata archaeon]